MGFKIKPQQDQAKQENRKIIPKGLFKQIAKVR